jgi:hypothetical protein
MDIPAAWKGKDIKDDGSWIYHWSDKSIAVLEKGLAAVKAKGLTALTLLKKIFPFQSLLTRSTTSIQSLRMAKDLFLFVAFRLNATLMKKSRSSTTALA